MKNLLLKVLVLSVLLGFSSASAFDACEEIKNLRNGDSIETYMETESGDEKLIITSLMVNDAMGLMSEKSYKNSTDYSKISCKFETITIQSYLRESADKKTMKPLDITAIFKNNNGKWLLYLEEKGVKLTLKIIKKTSLVSN